MADGRSRLEFLKEMGRAAVAGVKTAATGVDVVVEPEAAPALIGTEIGRRALAAAEHRVAAAALAATGSAVAEADLLAGVAVTLAVYPGGGADLIRQAVGLVGEPLPPDGDLEVAATARDLAWLPLGIGRQIYARVAGARLLAVGGYRRAALVRFEGARPRYDGVWCALGEDELLPAGANALMEEPDRLLTAISRGQVGMAALGGALLQAVSGAVVVKELDPVPLWGLFSTGRTCPVARVSDPHIVLSPLDPPGEVER